MKALKIQEIQKQQYLLLSFKKSKAT